MAGAAPAPGVPLIVPVVQAVLLSQQQAAMPNARVLFIDLETPGDELRTRRSASTLVSSLDPQKRFSSLLDHFCWLAELHFYRLAEFVARWAGI
jgi:hypothetical protein